MKTLILSLIFLTQALAQNSQKVKKGEPAPFDGHVVKKERLVKLIKAEKKNITLKDLAATQEEIADYHRGQARVYRKKLSEAKFDAWISNVGYFTLGIILTGFAFKVSGKIQDI